MRAESALSQGPVVGEGGYGATALALSASLAEHHRWPGVILAGSILRFLL